MSQSEILHAVQNQYGAVARGGLTNDSEAVRAIAQAFGYTEGDLASLPPQANMGLSCGNPVAVAALRPGEVVVDLGCGGGLDVLLAAQRVGPTGKAIGIDMTPDMLARAKAGAAQVGATNVEFHLAQIDQLPLPDASVDCIISNCVINLTPDKPKVFREMLRVLKPGGRIAISDIALKQPLPAEVASDLQAYVGCIAGALLISEYKTLLRDAGFDAVVVQDTGANLNAYAQAGAGGCCTTTGCCSTENQPADASPVHEGLVTVLDKFNANDFAASVRVHAIKSANATSTNLANQGKNMNTIQVFDKPMCCSTGVCGPDVDPVLPRFAADLEWLKSQGHSVQRFNLAQEPMAFAQNATVQQLLTERGTTCLPIVLINGVVVSSAEYPGRELFAAWDGQPTPSLLPVVNQGKSCCGNTGCC